ncbi:MAG: Re/Si-specific NAD(P)(+) transhydrogenase subunit alpha [Rhizobiales bacterium]|nr:Re/Si-specific NAD(P)(+) transhydrogenase subunit alpha [Hyphomicrobiales bacterium]
MVTIAVPVEGVGEPRAAISPETVKKYVALGCDVRIQTGAGVSSNILDTEFEEMGATIAGSLSETLTGADIVLKVLRPTSEEIELMGEGTVVAAILNPHDDTQELEVLASKKIKAFAMEFMPRITRAQSMDVLSSQSNLAGYKAVIDSAAHFTQAMPMMMTAAGTVPPAKVFVMGAGVAGLQAIATAKRLGAIVTATDVRPAAKEQVESLGGKFIAVENDEFKEAETAGGYAKEMSDDYKREQAELVANHIKNQDIVITTALIPGRPAPKLISADMVRSMATGSIIYDMAVERGGNCELAKPGEIVNENGVLIMGPLNIPGALAGNATSLYAKNLYNFLALMIDKEEGLKIDFEDEIIQGTLVTNDGKIVHPRLTGETS